MSARVCSYGSAWWWSRGEVGGCGVGVNLGGDSMARMLYEHDIHEVEHNEMTVLAR